MTGKTVGTAAIGVGILIAILTIHFWTVVAVVLVAGGAGTRAISSDRSSGVLTGKAKRALR